MSDKAEPIKPGDVRYYRVVAWTHINESEGEYHALCETFYQGTDLERAAESYRESRARDFKDSLNWVSRETSISHLDLEADTFDRWKRARCCARDAATFKIADKKQSKTAVSVPHIS